MRSLRTVSVSLLALACGALSAQPQTPAGQSRVVRYDLKMADLKYVFGAAPPVLRVRPGDVIETSTVDAEGKAQQAAGMKADGPNALTGPFYVEGAQCADRAFLRGGSPTRGHTGSKVSNARYRGQSRLRRRRAGLRRIEQQRL